MKTAIEFEFGCHDRSARRRFRERRGHFEFRRLIKNKEVTEGKERKTLDRSKGDEGKTNFIGAR